MRNSYNKKYAIGNVIYKRWQSLLLVLLGGTLILSGVGVLVGVGTCLVVAFLIIGIKSKPVPDSGKLDENEHSDS